MYNSPALSLSIDWLVSHFNKAYILEWEREVHKSLPRNLYLVKIYWVASAALRLCEGKICLIFCYGCSWIKVTIFQMRWVDVFLRILSKEDWGCLFLHWIHLFLHLILMMESFVAAHCSLTWDQGYKNNPEISEKVGCRPQNPVPLLMCPVLRCHKGFVPFGWFCYGYSSGTYPWEMLVAVTKLLAFLLASEGQLRWNVRASLLQIAALLLLEYGHPAVRSFLWMNSLTSFYGLVYSVYLFMAWYTFYGLVYLNHFTDRL